MSVYIKWSRCGDIAGIRDETDEKPYENLYLDD